MKNFIKKNSSILEMIVVIFFLLLLDILISARYNIKINIIYYLLTISSVTLIPSLIMLIPHKKTRFVLNIVIMFVSLILFITDSCLFFYKEDIFSWAMLLDIGDGLTVGLKYNVFVAFPFWLWFLLFIVFIVCIVLLKLINNQLNVQMKFSKYVFFGLASLILLTSGIYIKEEDRNLYLVPQDKRTYLRTFGFSTFNQKDVIQTLESLLFSYQLKAKATNILTDISDENIYKSPLFASQEGKNLIMIMTETVEQYAIDPLLTPTLYQLYNSSYFFTNTYGVAKTNYTYDAEFKALTSMMYYNNDNLMHSFANNTFNNSLPSLLKNKGYSVNAFHSYYGSFFNRQNMYRALGFEKYYAYEDMTFSSVDFWPLDSEFFFQNRELIAPVQEEPFFSFLITLSTHGAFHEKRSEFSPYYEIINQDGRFTNHEDEFINLLAAQMDLDLGLSYLISYLAEKSLLNDTIILMFSDHKNYSSLEITKKYTPLINEYELYNYEYDIIPFSIYNPLLPTREISYLSSQYDIMPTICDLLGISLKKDYVYGQSIFLYDIEKYEKKPIILGYHRWISPDLIVYDKEIVYIKENINNSQAYINKVQNEVYNTISRFHAFFITDYFKDYKP